MALDPNSYGTVPEVEAFSRHLMDGEDEFNANTRPTLEEVEGMMDRASATLNTALAEYGFTIPITQEDAKRTCDEFVVMAAKELVALSRPDRAAFTPTEDGHVLVPFSLMREAYKAAERMYPGFLKLGVELDPGESTGAGLKFTGQDAASVRTDPDDTTLRQPRFKRGMFED